MSYITTISGKHFDPKLAELFIEAEDEVRRIAEEIAASSNTKVDYKQNSTSQEE